MARWSAPCMGACCWTCNPRRRSRATCITRRWRCIRAARLPGSCSRHRCWRPESPHWNWRQAASERNSRAVWSSIPGHPLNPEYPMSAVAENIQTGMPAPILFTDSAAAKVAQLIAEEGNPELKLRVFVQGGGCSGFQYGFTFDEITNEDDTTMTKNGVSLLIDAMSYQYLVGAEIDYKEDLQGAQFVIKNPNATTTCGCGSSFSA